MRFDVVKVGFHLTTLHLACTIVLLADVSIEAVGGAAFALTRAGITLEYILQNMTCLRLEFIVVVGTIRDVAVVLQVEIIAGLLLAKAEVVDGPFVLGWRSNDGVDSLTVFVEGNETWYRGSRQ